MINRNLSFTEYRALPGVNWSSLKHLERSPAHYMEAIINPAPSTPAMTLGRAVHTMILEGEAAFAGSYAVAPVCDRRTTAGRAIFAAFEQEAQGKGIITADQYEAIQGMAACVLAHPAAFALLGKCRDRELSLSWGDPATGTLCKCRADAWAEREGLIVDLKTTDDASPEAFGRSAYKYGYHGQAALYTRAMQCNGLPPGGFLFVVVEKAPPYACAVYLADEVFMEAGRALVDTLLAQYAECSNNQSWPGYSPTVQTLSLPRWAA